MAFTAMIEGIIVRELDKRFGCPVPTYAEKKRMEREEEQSRIKQLRKPQNPHPKSTQPQTKPQQMPKRYQ